MFSGVLQHGYVPHEFKFGIIIPLLKDTNGDTTSADNYRGITSSSTISKLLELCLQSLFFDYLSMSNLQFGFKTNIGCTSAIYTLRSVIQYYNKRGSTVNLCMLDMSKAFDKVNHYAMFIKLMNRNVPVVILRVLVNWYDKCDVCVRWNDALSRCFYLYCGVRQGGILSPLLFASRVCAVAQYAVLEANGKVNGIGEISHLSSPKPLDQFGCRFKYITTSPQGVDVQNLIKIDSAVAAVRMREKNAVMRGFFFVYISIRLSVLRHAYRPHF